MRTRSTSPRKKGKDEDQESPPVSIDDNKLTEAETEDKKAGAQEGTYEPSRQEKAEMDEPATEKKAETDNDNTVTDAVIDEEMDEPATEKKAETEDEKIGDEERSDDENAVTDAVIDEDKAETEDKVEIGTEEVEVPAPESASEQEEETENNKKLKAFLAGMGKPQNEGISAGSQDEEEGNHGEEANNQDEEEANDGEEANNQDEEEAIDHPSEDESQPAQPLQVIDTEKKASTPLHQTIDAHSNPLVNEPEVYIDVEEYLAEKGMLPDVIMPVKKGERFRQFFTGHQKRLHFYNKLNSAEQKVYDTIKRDLSTLKSDTRASVSYQGDFGNVHVTVESIMNLFPPKWVNDEVINYMVVLTRAAAEKNRENEDILVFDSYFLASLLDLDGRYCFSRSIQRILKKYTKQPDGTFRSPLTYHKIIFAFNHGGAHWACLCIFPKANGIESFCSTGTVYKQELRTLYLLLHDWSNADWVHHDPLGPRFNVRMDLVSSRPSVRHQENGYDCGIFTIQYITALAVNGRICDINKQQTTFIRQRFLLWFFAISALRDLKTYTTNLPNPLLNHREEDYHANNVIVIQSSPTHSPHGHDPSDTGSHTHNADESSPPKSPDKDESSETSNRKRKHPEPENVPSNPQRWMVKNKKFWDEFMSMINKMPAESKTIRYPELLEKESIREFFRSKEIDHTEKDFPMTDATLEQLLKQIASGTAFCTGESQPDVVMSNKKPTQTMDPSGHANEENHPFTGEKRLPYSPAGASVSSAGSKRNTPPGTDTSITNQDGGEDDDDLPHATAVEVEEGSHASVQPNDDDINQDSKPAAKTTPGKKPRITLRNITTPPPVAKARRKTSGEESNSDTEVEQSPTLPKGPNGKRPIYGGKTPRTGGKSLNRDPYNPVDASDQEVDTLLKLQRFSKLHDEFTYEVEKIDRTKPKPPEWYTEELDMRIEAINKNKKPVDFANAEEQEKKERLARRNVIAQHLSERGEKKGNTRAAMQELHNYRADVRKWEADKNKKVSELEKSYKAKTKQVYDEATEEAQQLFKGKDGLQHLITNVEVTDTRKSGPLYQKLQELFPERNFFKYTIEERKAYDNWVKNLSEEKRGEHLIRRTEVNQISRIQFIKGTKTRPQHFKGQLLDPDTHKHKTLGEQISPLWMKQNFNPLFVAIVKKGAGKWIPVPVGDSTDDKAPKMFRTTLQMKFRQRSLATCLPSSFANAIWYLGEKHDNMNMRNAAQIIALKAEELESSNLKAILDVLGNVMKEMVPEIGQYSWFNQHRNGRKMNKLSQTELIEVLTPYPTIVIPVGNDGSVSHAFTVVDDLLFDSTQKYVLKLGKQTIDWVCGDCGCGSIKSAIRFWLRSHKKAPEFDHKFIKFNWET